LVFLVVVFVSLVFLVVVFNPWRQRQPPASASGTLAWQGGVGHGRSDLRKEKQDKPFPSSVMQVSPHTRAYGGRDEESETTEVCDDTFLHAQREAAL
jgi:hypothetical protein